MILHTLNITSRQADRLYVPNVIIRDLFARTCYANPVLDGNTDSVDVRFERFLADPTIWGFDVVTGYDPRDRGTRRLLSWLRRDDMHRTTYRVLYTDPHGSRGVEDDTTVTPDTSEGVETCEYCHYDDGAVTVDPNARPCVHGCGLAAEPGDIYCAPCRSVQN